MRVLAFSTVLLLAALPAASAGSPELPEMVCPEGDVRMWPGAPAPAHVAGPVDLLAAYFYDETATTVRLALRVADMSYLELLEPNPEGRIDYGAQFTIDDARYTTLAGFNQGNWYFRSGRSTEAGGEVDMIEGEVDLGAGTVVWILRMDFLRNPSATTNATLTRLDALHYFPPSVAPSDICTEEARPFFFSTSSETTPPTLGTKASGPRSSISSAEDPAARETPSGTPSVSAPVILMLIVGAARFLVRRT